jgi:hypothetical protein
MKSYPSITTYKESTKFSQFYTFDKIDGSNLRFEWTKKKGWEKFGTRKRLFDETDSMFGEAVPLFFDTLSNDLEEVFAEVRYNRVIAFCEFWGERSFAGRHVPEDEKHLTLIDISVYKKGILAPKEFVSLFGHLLGTKYLGYVKWNDDFVQLVRNLKPDEGSTQAEGAVGKVVYRNKIYRYKLKSDWWYDRVYKMYDAKEAAIIVNS